MAENKRIYVVTDVTTSKKTLVEASSANQAIRLIADRTYSVKVATTIQVADYVRNGATILQAVDKVSPPIQAAPVAQPDSIGGQVRTPEDLGEYNPETGEIVDNDPMGVNN